MKKLIAVSIVALYLVAFLPANSAMAQATNGGGVTQNASITFDPAGGDIYKDQPFEVDVIVNTANQDSAAADVTVKYDRSRLEFVSGIYPDSTTFYPNNRIIYPIASDDSGKISMARTVSTPASGSIVYTKGTGIFATLAFRVKATANVGETATLSFDYTAGASNDFTNVANAASPAADLLGTSTLPTATYTIKAGGAVPVGDDPQITSIAPSSGSAKNTVRVTINGTNFDTFVEGSSKVYLGTKLVNIISWTDTQIVVEVAAEPDLVNDSVRQVKVHRADGKEATYTGYRLVGSGPEVFVFGGITLMALFLAWFVYRRTYNLVPAASYAVTAMPMPIMNYQPESPVSQITYRNLQ